MKRVFKIYTTDNQNRQIIKLFHTRKKLSCVLKTYKRAEELSELEFEEIINSRANIEQIFDNTI